MDKEISDYFGPLTDRIRPAPGIAAVQARSMARRRRRRIRLGLGAASLLAIAVVASAALAQADQPDSTVLTVDEPNADPATVTDGDDHRCAGQMIAGPATEPDSLPPAAAATTDWDQVDRVRVAMDVEIRDTYSNVEATSVVQGDGYEWVREPSGEIIVRPVVNFAIRVFLRSKSDCPPPSADRLHATFGGVPVQLVAPSNGIEGSFGDGQPWTVFADPEHGLCVTFGPTNLGCDDIGPVLAPDSDPATPRWGGDKNLLLAYAFLPEGAVGVMVTATAGAPPMGTPVVDVEAGLWAIPGTNPEDTFAIGKEYVVEYRMADGSFTLAPTAY